MQQAAIQRGFVQCMTRMLQQSANDENVARRRKANFDGMPAFSASADKEAAPASSYRFDPESQLRRHDRDYVL
jgi:hypothetical protein